MNRKRKWGPLIQLAGAVIVTACAVWAVCAVSGQMTQEETDALRSRVRTAAISCYAAEGRYPRSLSYLEEAYGLRYDKTRFAVRYDAFASNVLPDIDVHVLEGAWTR